MPRSGAEVTGAKVIGGTNLGSGLRRWMERSRGGRRSGGGEFVPFSSLMSPSLPIISLCNSALVPAGGVRVARAGAHGT